MSDKAGPNIKTVGKMPRIGSKRGQAVSRQMILPSLTEGLTQSKIQSCHGRMTSFVNGDRAVAHAFLSLVNRPPSEG